MSELDRRGCFQETRNQGPKNESGCRPNKLHQWLTDDIGNPMLAQHLHSIVMFQRLAIASGFGWKRFVSMVDQVMPPSRRDVRTPLFEAQQ